MTNNDPNKILIVEDEPAIRRLYNLLISLHFPGLSVDAVCDGVDAVSSFARSHPATILMDSKMPVLDGVTACLHLQKICMLKNWQLPKFIICAGTLSRQERLLLGGIDPLPAMLAKPIHNRDLIHVLGATLQDIQGR